eukprot:COSAG05_NODE_1032_length_6088_cov_23.885624_5_plen_49_part_00
MYHYDFTCVPYTNSLLICLLKPNAQTRAQPLAIYRYRTRMVYEGTVER